MGKIRNCTWCKSEVKPPRRSWCSQKCVDEYKDLNDWNWILRKVFERDKGVCVACGCDTEKLRRVLTTAFRRVKEYEIETFYRKYVTLPYVRSDLEKRMGFKPAQSYWECDHVLERVRGGTNEMSNLQSLCVPCHKRKTARLAGERALERRAAKLIQRDAGALPLFVDQIGGS